MKKFITQTLTITLLSLLCGLTLAEETKITEETPKPSILITGANRGLGLELAKQFLLDGYTVYGTSRKPAEAIELKEAGAEVLQLDVTSEESIAALAKSLEGKPLDILVNNAGYFGPNKIGETQSTIDNVTRGEIEFTHAVNTMGPIFVTQALMPNLRAGTQKRIMTISSRSGMISRSGGGAMGYRMSKAGVNMATVVLHAQLKKQGFIVASLAPGHNNTDMGRGAKSGKGKLDPSQSMAKVKNVIETLTPKQSGGFWYYDGKRLPW